MSELINNRNKYANIRLGLLATTSAIALAACVASVTQASAADPTVWIEGGWHFDSNTGSGDTLVPPLDSLATAGYPDVPTATNFRGQGSGGFSSFTDIENILGRSSGAEGSISFQPRGSDWVFNVSARYGRTHSKRHIQQRADAFDEPTYETNALYTHHLKTEQYTNYTEQDINNTEAHTIVDFKVGKDVGLGLFGERTDSIFSFGARYVQMNMSSAGHSYGNPAVRFYGHGGVNVLGKYQYIVQPDHQNSATLLQRHSSFHGLGPSLSWSNTTGLLGNPVNGQVALDWGVNAAVLFGRQRAKIDYSTVAHLYHVTPGFGQAISTPQHRTGHRTESRRVTVPNLGGFAGLSYRLPNARISAGYRADFFFGALDRGLDTHKSVTTGYNGPYATIAIGLGG